MQERDREWKWRLLSRDSGAVVVLRCSWPGGPGEDEEESQSYRDPQGGSERMERGVRAAAEHCTLRQTGTQWPQYNTGWQGL